MSFFSDTRKMTINVFFVSETVYGIWLANQRCNEMSFLKLCRFVYFVCLRCSCVSNKTLNVQSIPYPMDQKKYFNFVHRQKSKPIHIAEKYRISFCLAELRKFLADIYSKWTAWNLVNIFEHIFFCLENNLKHYNFFVLLFS